MELRPILTAMLRNKTGAVLVGLQIAITLAVVANSVFIMLQRLEKIGRPTGIDSDNLIFVQSYGYGPNYDHRETVRYDLDMLRAMPGVVAASTTNGVPVSGGGSSSDFRRTPQSDEAEISANYYTLDEQGVAAMGASLAEGREFTQEEIQYHPDPARASSEFVPSVILTRDLAHAIFGEEPALGRNVYDTLGQSAVVVGVIDNMLNAWVGSDDSTHVILLPRISPGPISRYVVRTEPGRRDALIPEIERKLAEAPFSRAITWVRPHDYYIDRSYRADSRMVSFLGVIIVLMVSVTALGVVGLASFYVNVRRKQIGTRRAMGARRIDIIRYFMVENGILTTGGVVAGTVLAFAFGHWLSITYALPRLEPVYVAAGTAMLWVLGQLAVFVPARRAAGIPPAVATRTV